MTTQTDLMQSLINSTDTVFFIKDEDGRFLFVNPAFEKLFELSKEDVLGKTDYDFVTPENAERYREHDHEITHKGSPLNFTEWVDAPSGKHKYLCHKFPIENIEGLPHALGGIAIDITEQV